MHHRAAQVDHPVGQADVFREVFVVDLERRGGGGVEHFDLFGENFDFARNQVGVGGAGRAFAHDAGDGQHIFIARSVGGLEGFRGVRVDHHLHQAFAVAQVDEDHAAVVAATVRPALDGDRLAKEFLSISPQ